MVLLPRRWREQPPGLVEIDWSHPLARGLVFLWLGIPGNPFDLVKGKRATVTGVSSKLATKDGFFQAFDSASWLDFPVFAANELSVNQPMSIGWRQANVSQTTYGTLFEIKCSDTVPGANFLVLQHAPSGGANYHFSAGPAGGAAMSWATAVPDAAFVAGVPYRYVITALAGIGDVSNSVGNWTLFADKSKLAPSSPSISYSSSSASAFKIGNDEFNEYFNGQVGMVAVWNRALTDIEAFAYNENPWQLLQPQSVAVGFQTTAAAPLVGTPTQFDRDMRILGWFS